MNSDNKILFLGRVGELSKMLPTGLADPHARQKLERERSELRECIEKKDTPGALLEAADCLYYAVKIYFNPPPLLGGLDALVEFYNSLAEISAASGFSQRAVMDACIIKYTLRAQPGNPKNHENEVAAIRHLVDD